MTTLNFKKVDVAPTQGEANTLYLVKEGDHFRTYLTDKDGVAVYRGTADATSVELNRYDLPVADAPTGVLDLMENQIFKIDLTSGAPVTVSFTNGPTRAMVVIIETVGSASTIIFPDDLVITEGTETIPGAISSIITLFWNGEKMYFMSNGRIA